MKTLFISIIAAVMLSNNAFAGAGTLFKNGIGLPDWSFRSSPSVKKNTASKAAMKTVRTKSQQTDHRVTAR